MFQNMFRQKTDQQKNQDIIKQVETLKDLEELTQLGKNMLADERYNKYRKLLDEALKKVIKDLLEYAHQDNDTYATNVRVLITQIKSLISFVDMPISFLNYTALQRFEMEGKTE